MINASHNPQLYSDIIFFEKIYRKYLPLMRKIAYETTYDYNISDDLVHDAFIKLADKFDLLQELDEKKRVAYITRTIRNISLDYNKKTNIRNQKKHDLFDDSIIDSIPDLSLITMEEVCCKNEKVETLLLVLGKLPKRDCRLLVCKYIFELKDSEISTKLNIPSNNIRQYLTRARRRASQEWSHLDKS